MKLDRIEIFCAVARNMSFTKAAEECGVAQSAISMQIKALEDELGFPLFESCLLYTSDAADEL